MAVTLGKRISRGENIITHEVGQGGLYYGSTTQHAGSKCQQNVKHHNKRTVKEHREAYLLVTELTVQQMTQQDLQFLRR